LRAIILLISLLEEHVAVHTLKFMAALAAGMEGRFSGAVREQAMCGWQQLVRSLACYAQDMLRQVASQIVAHVLAVLGEKGRGVGGDEARRREEAAAVDLLHELIVTNAEVLGTDVLATLPPLPDDILTHQLAGIRQVCCCSTLTLGSVRCGARCSLHGLLNDPLGATQSSLL
jgi:hypothetical protein